MPRINDLQRFDREWRTGNRDRARQMARNYVASHREEIAPVLQPLTLAEIVVLVGEYRARGLETDRIIADMWLLTEYPPQHITGTVSLGAGQED